MLGTRPIVPIKMGRASIPAPMQFPAIKRLLVKIILEDECMSIKYYEFLSCTGWIVVPKEIKSLLIYLSLLPLPFPLLA